MSGITDGCSFLMAANAMPAAVWGNGDSILWSAGEPLIIVGPQSIGKSTLLQRLTMSRLGLAGEQLGLAVQHDGRKERALYIAADRPKQIARSWRRMVEPSDLDEMRERLVVWEGPLEFDIGREPERLAEFVQQYDVQTVVIDSLKDVAHDLTKDETGSRINSAFQRVVALGIELAANHHNRKGLAGGPKPKSLEDVYGSTWITAGCGSIILLWGTPGDPIVELSHLKPPVEMVGPFKVIIDNQNGRMRLFEQVDLLELLRGSNGMTARAAACELFGSTDPTANDVEKARRRLAQLETRGVAWRDSPGRPMPDTWWPANHDANHARDSETPITPASEKSDYGSTIQSRAIHAQSRPGESRSSPPL
jgi:replicative DNA helicase